MDGIVPRHIDLERPIYVCSLGDVLWKKKMFGRSDKKTADGTTLRGQTSWLYIKKRKWADTRQQAMTVLMGDKEQESSIL